MGTTVVPMEGCYLLLVHFSSYFAKKIKLCAIKGLRIHKKINHNTISLSDCCTWTIYLTMCSRNAQTNKAKKMWTTKIGEVLSS